MRAPTPGVGCVRSSSVEKCTSQLEAHVDQLFSAGLAALVDSVEYRIEGEAVLARNGRRLLVVDGIHEGLDFRGVGRLHLGNVHGCHVEHLPVLLGEDLDRVVAPDFDCRTGLRPEELSGERISIQVAHEGTLQGDDGAVIELDETNREVFDGELVPVVVTPVVKEAGVLAEDVPRLSGGRNRLWVAHHEKGEVKDVDADVDERSAALLVLLDEHAPTGHAAAAEGLGASEVDVAQVA